MKILKILLGASLILGLSQSCRKDDNAASTETVDQTTIQKEAVVNTTVDSDVDIAMDLGQTAGLMSKGGIFSNPNYPCANITLQTTNGNFPKTLTIDFGTTGCTTPNGITRKGKIIITYSDKIRNPGSVITVTRDNYYVNSNKIEGTVVFTNITTTPSVPAWSKVVTDGKITHADGSYTQFTTNRKQRMIEGASTPMLVSDDVFEIYEGSQNIVRSNGTYLNSVIKTSLIKKNTCPFISKGSVTLKGTKLDGVLDFGNGDCDNQATYTDANGVVHQITL